MSKRGVKVIVLLGAPGSGKGTQAKRLVEKHPTWVHISTGDLFRKEIAGGSILGKKLAEILAAGQLVKDELTCDVFESQVRRILKERPETEAFLLDGFPRTAAQSEALLRFTEASANLGNPKTIEFLVNEEALVERLSGRLVNPRSGRVYHLQMNPPKEAMVDDEDGGALMQRPDDRPAVIRERFEIYQGQRDAIVGVLERHEAPTQLDAAGDAAHITQSLEKLIGQTAP